MDLKPHKNFSEITNDKVSLFLVCIYLQNYSHIAEKNEYFNQRWALPK